MDPQMIIPLASFLDDMNGECGDLSYSYTFSPSVSFITYNSIINTLYIEDTTLTGSNLIVLVTVIADLSGFNSDSQFFNIEIIDPCINMIFNPFSIPDTVYNVASSKIVISFLNFSPNPSVCQPVTYNALMNNTTLDTDVIIMDLIE
jgi:hypothetical protein